MTKFTNKPRRILIGTAALAAIATALPVMASQSGSVLRGAWTAAQNIIPAGSVVAPQSQYGDSALYNSCNAYQPCYAAPSQLRAALRHNVGQNIDIRSLPAAPIAPKSWGVPSVDMNTLRGHRDVTYAINGYGQQAYPNAYDLASYQAKPVVSGSYSPAYAALGNTAGSAYDVGGLSVRTNAAHTNRMLDWQESTTGKALTILAHRQSGVLAPNTLYLGAGVKGGFMYQKTDTAGQFPILSRFPFFSRNTDRESGVFAINNAALAITGTFGEWTNIYLQPEYSETEFAGDQDELQLRKAFVTFGNLDRTPFYAAFGRKTIDFGNFDGYNPFTHTEAQHYFWALSDQPVLELGYYKDGLKLSASAFSGGRQLRTAYANEENNITNYAASLEKEWLLGRGRSFTVGTSYLHDSIYRNNWTAHTFAAINEGTPPANLIEYRNSVGSAFAEYNSPYLDMMLEYTSTFEPWAAAIPQDVNGNVLPAYLDSNGDIDFDEKLSTLVAQARIKPIIAGKRTAFSLVGSWGNISDDDYTGISNLTFQPVTFGSNQQHALGVEREISPYFDFGAEIVYNKGFIPFVAPQEVSNQDTEAIALNIGFKARF